MHHLRVSLLLFFPTLAVSLPTTLGEVPLNDKAFELTTKPNSPQTCYSWLLSQSTAPSLQSTNPSILTPHSPPTIFAADSPCLVVPISPTHIPSSSSPPSLSRRQDERDLTVAAGYVQCATLRYSPQLSKVHRLRREMQRWQDDPRIHRHECGDRRDYGICGIVVQETGATIQFCRGWQAREHWGAWYPCWMFVWAAEFMIDYCRGRYAANEEYRVGGEFFFEKPEYPGGRMIIGGIDR